MTIGKEGNNGADGAGQRQGCLGMSSALKMGSVNGRASLRWYSTARDVLHGWRSPSPLLRFSCGSSDTLSPCPSKSLELHSAKEKTMFLCILHSLECGREKQWVWGVIKDNGAPDPISTWHCHRKTAEGKTQSRQTWEAWKTGPLSWLLLIKTTELLLKLLLIKKEGRLGLGLSLKAHAFPVMNLRSGPSTYDR